MGNKNSVGYEIKKNANKQLKEREKEYGIIKKKIY